MRLCLFLLGIACCLPATGYAQSTEAALKARLIGQPLYLRGSWGADTLHFDSTGQLVGASDHRSFMLCGVDVKDIHLEKDQLVIDGKRMGVELSGTIAKRVALKGSEGHPFSRKEEIHIEILRPSDGDYSSALTSIFANGLAELTPLLPEYWQSYAHRAFPPVNGPDSTMQPTITTLPDGVKQVGGSVKPPVLIGSPTKPNIDMTRQLSYSPNILIDLIVGKDGFPSHLQLLQPGGLGLDEESISTVSKYRFNPATENGLPVAVQIRIEFNLEP